MTIYQDKRWNKIIKHSKDQAKKSGLSEEFIINYINAVHNESIDQQGKVMKNGIKKES